MNEERATKDRKGNHIERRRSGKMVFFFFLVFFSGSTAVKATFDFNANCQKAYQLTLNLKLNAARQLIAQEKKSRPGNAFIPLLENYVDYFYLLSSDNKQEFERLSANKNRRLDELARGDKSSPYYLYAQAEVNLQWALLRGRFGAYYHSARELSKANQLFKQNFQKFPSFQLNKKGLGIIQTLIGAVPDGILRTILNTFGLKGDTETGLNYLHGLAENLPKSTFEPFYEEVIFYYSFVLTDVVKSPHAYAKVLKYTHRFETGSLMKTYLLSYAAFRNGFNEETIQIINQRPKGSEFQAFPFLEYLLGRAKLNKLDVGATTHFERFLQQNKGVNYLKDVYLHLAWMALLQGDESKAASYMKRVKSEGHTYHDRDKQALAEADNPLPNKWLLTARLLSDGKYLDQALQTIQSLREESLQVTRDRIEYSYRKARILEELNRENEALLLYKETIEKGRSTTFYFAAKAAVWSARIYEARKNFDLAATFYQLAIQMKNHEFEASIEYEAKQGLKRIGRS